MNTPPAAWEHTVPWDLRHHHSVTKKPLLFQKCAQRKWFCKTPQIISDVPPRCPPPSIWIPGRSDGLSGVALESCSCSPTPVLSLRGVEGNGADVVSEVVPTKHQASGLGAALMSSPEWIAGWWRWPVPSPPPHSAYQALIGGRKKRDFRFTGNNALVKKEKKNSISASCECKPLHPNYNFQLRSEDYISQYVLRPRTRTCVKWEVSGVLFGRHAKNLLFFHIILITFLAQSTWGLLLLLTAKRPDEWNPNALYWWNFVIARERLVNLNNQWHLLPSSCVLTPASFIFKYFIIKPKYL